MASNAKRDPNGTWRIQYRYTDWTGTKRKSQKRGFKTKKEAEEWLAHFKYQQSSDPSMPLRDFWKIYMDDMSKRLKETTIENKEHIWRCKIEPYFGDLPINEITASRIRRWQGEMMEKGFKPTYLSKDIADYKELADGKVNEAVEAKIEAKKNAKLMVDVAKKRERIAWGSLAATIFCCLVAYPVFLNDLWDAITRPFIWVWNGINDYAYWLQIPYYSRYIEGVEKRYAYSTGIAWLLRITSVFFTVALTVGICYGIWITIQYYRKRWCSLSLKVLLISTGAVIVFGEGIHNIMSINLVGVLIFIQVTYLGALIYLDGYFETRSRDRDWEKLQNQ